MLIIENTTELVEVCEKLSRADYITVDTEFMRDNTYYSRLCLVQIACSEGAWAIDPLAEGIDLAPFFEVLASPETLKVFHAARQDIEIFLHLSGTIPEPLFDTQVAGMVCGFGDAVSYEKLAAKLAGARLDKSQRFTDWSRRPLTERQIKYALGDVTHLRQIFESLEAQLNRNGRHEWLDEEMEVLLSPETYRLDKEKVWRRLKTRSTDRRFLAIVRALANWREAEAQRRDLPRNRIIRDDAILEAAAHPPRSLDDLKTLRSLPGQFRSAKRGESLVAAIKEGLSVPDDALPEAEKRAALPPGIGPLVELLKVLLKLKCEVHDVAQKLVANVADLEQIAADDNANVPALRGWRRDLFGGDALALKHGRVALSAQGKKVILVPLESND
ncbi:MAG: ribonuclease D [Sphingomonadales bacterium]